MDILCVCVCVLTVIDSLIDVDSFRARELKETTPEVFSCWRELQRWYVYTLLVISLCVSICLHYTSICILALGFN